MNAKGYYGMTALHYGCQNGHANVIPALVDAGADVNAKSTPGITALHYGCLGGHANVVPALVDAGADVNARDNGTALHYACCNGHANVEGSVEVLLDPQGHSPFRDPSSGITQGADPGAKWLGQRASGGDFPWPLG